MSTHLTNVNEEDIVNNDKLTVVEKDCEWNIFIKKSSSADRPCPWAENFSLAQWEKSWLIPSWCYDWDEVVSISDTNLVPSNIKIWVTIFETLWTDPWPLYTIWNNIVLSDWLTTWVVSAWLYLWKTISLFDSDLISWNIKDGSSVLWVSWNWRWEEFDAGIVNNSYHTWYSHSYVVANSENTYAVQAWVIWNWTYTYFCYSSRAPLSAYPWTTAQRDEAFYTILRYDWTSLTTIVNTNISYKQYVNFRQKNSTTFSIEVIWSPNTYYDVDMTTWAITAWTDTSANALIPSSILLWNKTYYPILETTKFIWSNWNNTFTWQSLNIKITR